MKHASLFSGIGGFDLAAEWAGWENMFHCEWNEFGQKVLNYYWPKAISYGDITKTDFSIWRGEIDVLTGGFPCQPYSLAGKRLGKEDERHLWPEMLRAIREIKPKWVVGENVLGITNWNGGLVFNEVQSDLEAQGYEVQSYVLPAASVNAPHRRDRVWFVAHACRIGTLRQQEDRSFCQDWREDQFFGVQASERINVTGNDISERKNGIIINSNDKRTSAEFREIQAEDGEIPKRNEDAEFGNTSAIAYNTNSGIKNMQKRENGILSNNITPYTESKGAGQDIRGIRQRVRGIDDWETTDTKTSMHPDSPSEQGKYISQERQGESNRPDSRNGINDFKDFPTQSPLCSGDDGVSGGSYRETISKEYTMDRDIIMTNCLNEGRIETEPETGKIFSRRIRGKEGERVELSGSDCNGYLVHSIKYNGIKKQVRAHQVIWISVNGLYDKTKLMIDHINRDKKDNRIDNLRLVDAKGNSENSEHWTGNFSDQQKDEMFLLHIDGNMSFREIAEQYGCSKSRVHQLFNEHKFNRLDGITFSKWRNESIKAYGNAIVPGVVYQIFKAINKYENLHIKII